MVLSLFASRTARWYLAALCLCGSFATLVGCGDSTGKLAPVVGKVMVNGQPLTSGTGTGSVSFRPDKANATSLEPAGMIDQDGTYRLLTAGKEGAPLGRYHVLVVDMDPVDPKNPYGKRKSHVHLKYGDPKTSNLVIDVVQSPAPGAYDLKLTK